VSSEQLKAGNALRFSVHCPLLTAHYLEGSG